MGKQKTATGGISKIIFGMGGLSAVSEVVFVLLFLSEFAHLNSIALTVGVVVGAALPVLIMPIAYALINGNTAISTGRYHLSMAAAGLIAVISYVLLLGVGGISAVGQAFALIGLLFIHSLSMQIFMYTSFAVGSRFDRTGAANSCFELFSLCSVAIAVILLLLFGGTRDSVRELTALAGIVSLAGIAAAYFSTVRNMPNFIRLEPKHKRSLKENYRIFVSPLKSRTVVRLIVALFLLCAGISMAAATLPEYVFKSQFGLSGGFKPSVLVAAALAVTVGICVNKMSVKSVLKSGQNITLAFAAVMLALAAAVTVISFIPIAFAIKAVVLFTFAAVFGATVGAAITSMSKNRDYAVNLSGCSTGRYTCMRNCVVTLGFALGLGLGAAVGIFEVFGSAVLTAASSGVSAILILSGAIVARVCKGATRRITQSENSEQDETEHTETCEQAEDSALTQPDGQEENSEQDETSPHGNGKDGN